MASTAAIHKFNKDVVKSIDEIFGIKTTPPKKAEAVQLHLETKAGTLRITLSKPDPTPVFSIYCRFDDPKQAAEVVTNTYRLNHYSGKWNFHEMSAEECISKFKSEILDII
jgi:hypothetical protein